MYKTNLGRKPEVRGTKFEGLDEAAASPQNRHLHFWLFKFRPSGSSRGCREHGPLSGEPREHTERGFIEAPIYTGAQMLKTRPRTCHFLPLFPFATGRRRGCASLHILDWDQGIGRPLGVFRGVEKKVANCEREVAVRRASVVHYVENERLPWFEGSAGASSE
jgi:hypothetical protein